MAPTSRHSDNNCLMLAEFELEFGKGVSLRFVVLEVRTGTYSQDLETVCQKLAITYSKLLGWPIFHGGLRYSWVVTINLYLFIGIRHTFHIQCHGNHIELKIYLKCSFQIFLIRMLVS